MTSRVIARAGTVVALVAALIVIAVVVLGAGGGPRLRARFANAEGLVKGGSVEIAGHQVGKIAGIRLTDDGQALVDMQLDGGVAPLTRGTRARVRAVGQAGLANRFVELQPGPVGSGALDDGATLPTSQTSSIVDLDALLDSFGPRNRAGLQQLLAESQDVYAGSGARSFNVMLRRLGPATRQVAGVARELALDQRAISELVSTAAQTSEAVSARRDDLGAAVQNTADAFDGLATERRSISDVLRRAPGALEQATSTLDGTRRTAERLQPALRAVPAAAAGLRPVLTSTGPLLDRAHPTLARLNTELPQLDTVLRGVGPLRRPLAAALRSTGVSMRGLRPILKATRFYGPDLILGVFSGLVGITTGEYDARGHYVKVNFIQSYQSATSGPLADLLQQHPIAPSLLNVRTKQTRRCPGGLAAPAPDGSSPWVLGEKYCTAAHDLPASVDEP